MPHPAPPHAPSVHRPDSPYAWLRLVVTLLIVTVGSSGMYVISVVLPAVQADFGVARAAASLPYTLLMIGFGVGGVLMGRLADRYGVAWPLFFGAFSIGTGFIATSFAPSIMAFGLLQAVFIGLGSGAVFAPLVADTSLWFVRRRGIAVAICASGNYVAGAVWPPIVQHFVESDGWRTTYFGLGVFCALAMAGLALLLRERPPALDEPAPIAPDANGRVPMDATLRPFGLSLGMAQGLLCVAGTACCVAMAMPQVHIVAYCVDLGFGAARGAQMLSVMLAFGIVSRLVSGLICDRIGGLRTLMLGSALQGVALLMFLPFDGLVPLFVVSALFGLFQGGIVPAYAIIVREFFPPREASGRVGLVISFTLLGMALGGWLSGKVFDVTGSYHAAFINGIGWNLLNLCIAGSLLWRARRAGTLAPVR